MQEVSFVRDCPFKVGNPVVVKTGTLSPDFYFDIGGWGGWVTKIDRLHSGDQEWLLEITWNSETLQAIPTAFICEFSKEAIDWTTMLLYDTDVISTDPSGEKNKLKC